MSTLTEADFDAIDRHYVLEKRARREGKFALASKHSEAGNAILMRDVPERTLGTESRWGRDSTAGGL